MKWEQKVAPNSPISSFVKSSLHWHGKDYRQTISYSQIMSKLYTYKQWKKNTTDLKHIYV